jgi:hypothetical protein
VDPTLTILSTAEGNGQDVEMVEQNNPTAARNDVNLNTRFNANDRNEVAGLKFDLSGYTLAQLENVTLNFISHRDTSAREIDVYGVTQGASGGSGNFTTETWTDSTVSLWGDLPGLLTSDGNVATKSIDTGNLTLLANATGVGAEEGVTYSVSSAALTQFVQNYTGSSSITFLVTAADGYLSGGQFRFCSKEATSTESGVLTGNTGDLAPYLSFTIGVAQPPNLDYTITGGGTGIDFSWTGAFKLQSQTNALGTGLSTNWFDYPGGGTSPVSVPVDEANDSVFFRLAPQ